MRTYCTIFDCNYLPRGLALYESLKRGGDEFALWILCLDEAARAKLQSLRLPQLRLLGLEDLEAVDRDLLAAKSNRSALEYCFTCKAPLVLYIFGKDSSADSVTYVDGDIFYFSDPALVDAEIGDGSIAITPHAFPACLQERTIYGIYNAGWIWFRRDENSLRCLKWWREKCIEWCYMPCKPGLHADQKYLDKWPELFQGVKSLNHPGINLGLWNISSRHLSVEKGILCASGRPLIFYHFHALKQISPLIFDPHWADYHVKPTSYLRRLVYLPYLQALRGAARMSGAPEYSLIKQNRVGELDGKKPKIKISKRLQLMRDVLRGKYVYSP
jgi:hypothetical protein